MSDSFASPSSLRAFALETSTLLRAAGREAAASRLAEAAGFVTGSGWEWLGEIETAVDAIRAAGGLSAELAARLERIRRTTRSGRYAG